MTPFLMGIVGSPEMDDAWSNHIMQEIVACEKEQDGQEVFSDGKHLVYKHLTVGERPENGHSVYIALHDRTSSDFHENEQQWSYMLQRYHTSLREGLYVVPRNHFEKNDLFREQWAYPLIDRLIECLIITGEADPNRIFLMGYGTGAVSALELAVRMPDRFAGVHAADGFSSLLQETSFMNIPVSVQISEEDPQAKAVAAFGMGMAQLGQEIEGTHKHDLYIHTERYWNDYSSADFSVITTYKELLEGEPVHTTAKSTNAIRWLEKHTRNPWPLRVRMNPNIAAVKRVERTRWNYWLGKADEFADVEIIEGKNQIVVHEMGKTVQIFLHERLFQFEHPISIVVKGSQISLKPYIRPRIQEQSLRLRSDPTQIYSALLEIDCSQTCTVTERVDYHPGVVEQ